jgi:hypothetical protein
VQTQIAGSHSLILRTGELRKNRKDANPAQFNPANQNSGESELSFLIGVALQLSSALPGMLVPDACSYDAPKFLLVYLRCWLNYSFH